MFKLNNKGQSLVMFIIIIPIFCLILTLIYDVGNAIYEKNSLSNTSYIVIDYGLDNINNISDSELIDIVLKNTDKLSYIYVAIEDNQIEVKLSKNIKGILGRMFGFNLIEVNTYYKGNITNGKKIIERIK